MTLLKVSGVSKKGEGSFALANITFSQKKGQKIALTGETGSGKSTLLKIIAGLAQPDSGNVFFENKRVEGPEEKLVPGHPSVAYLSQNFELQKFLRVEQVLNYSNILSESMAETLFQVCQIDHLLKRRTDQLSGGERQRIALANLLISSPRLLLLDEPFTHLDIPHKNILKEVINDISSRLGITCILVSHDPDDTVSWADQILVMRNGIIIQKGLPSKVYREPVNEYVGGLFGKYNLLGSDDAKLTDALGIQVPRGKKLFLRPEDISISSKGKKSLNGITHRVDFYGSYFELTIRVAGRKIFARTGNEKLASRKKLFIKVTKGAHWFLRASPGK